MQDDSKQLLIVWHSHTGRTGRLAAAVAEGATAAAEEHVRVRCLRAFEAQPADLLAASALVVATPENFGAMSGGLKDFFERTYYACEGQVEGLALAIIVCAGNDGRGAVSSIQRIARGYPMREVQPARIVLGAPAEADLEAVRETGAALAAGLAMGLF